MKVLIRNGQGMRPMLAILNRHELGSVDKLKDGNSRGRWISEADLLAIREAIREDWPHNTPGTDDPRCQGTNIHNFVMFSEFVALFHPGHRWDDPEVKSHLQSISEEA